jgi:2-C-methyl-D-erythritol 4-phosphate cytidylyltransferase
MSLAALVLAAGRGERLGGDRPKAFVSLVGKSLVARSIETLVRVPLVDRVVPVIPPDELAGFGRLVPPDPKLASPVPGGVRRQDSVRAGLASLPSSFGWVAVHDAARCLVSEEEVEAVIRAAEDTGAAILARPSPDTLKLVRNGVIESTPARRSCWLAQTPQVFRTELLREALEKAHAEGFEATDDAQLVERLGVAVHVVSGSAKNLKITHPEDLWIAAALLEPHPASGDGAP